MKEFVSELFEKAVAQEASDLYIFPQADHFQVAFRINQEKLKQSDLAPHEAEKLILYLKYLGNMDVGEKRKIQIGACKVRVANQWRHIRISSVANFQHQESIVIRFLPNLSEETNFLVLQSQVYQTMLKEVRKKGLFLFAGVTGSGKTTTMYHLAKELSQQNKQIITIEDPVELEYADFLQLQVNEKINLTYDALIQLCLRHRPDVMIVGEIRDEETAKAVIRAALTGHTILTTIHGLDKYSVLSRLLELGVTAEDLRQCLRGVIYQQLLPIWVGEKERQAVWFDWLYVTDGKWSIEGEDVYETQKNAFKKLWALGYLKRTEYFE